MFQHFQARDSAESVRVFDCQFFRGCGVVGDFNLSVQRMQSSDPECFFCHINTSNVVCHLGDRLSEYATATTDIDDGPVVKVTTGRYILHTHWIDIVQGTEFAGRIPPSCG